MASQYITVETEDGPMPTYESTPEGQSRGAVVVVQEAFGITSHIESITVRLADAGWRALAPALFHRQGSPVFGYDDFSAVGPVMGQLSAEGITADVHAALDFLAADGVAPGATGIVGFCMGGAVSFYAATLRPLGAAVTFYGGGLREGRFGLPSLIELAPSLQTPWLGLYGDQDKGIPAEDVEGLREAAKNAPVATEVVRYPEGEHGFHCDARPDSFNEAAALDARRRALAFFADYLSDR